MNKSFAIPISSCKAREVHLCIMVYIWIRSRNCDCLVTRPCYQLIAKPGNKTATVMWPDPYSDFKCNNKRLFLINEPIVERNTQYCPQVNRTYELSWITHVTPFRFVVTEPSRIKCVCTEGCHVSLFREFVGRLAVLTDSRIQPVFTQIYFVIWRH